MKVKVNLIQWCNVRENLLERGSIGCSDIECEANQADCGNCIFKGSIRLQRSKLAIKED